MAGWSVVVPTFGGVSVAHWVLEPIIDGEGEDVYLWLHLGFMLERGVLCKGSLVRVVMNRDELPTNSRGFESEWAMRR